MHAVQSWHFSRCTTQCLTSDESCMHTCMTWLACVTCHRPRWCMALTLQVDLILCHVTQLENTNVSQSVCNLDPISQSVPSIFGTWSSTASCQVCFMVSACANWASRVLHSTWMIDPTSDYSYVPKTKWCYVISVSQTFIILIRFINDIFIYKKVYYENILSDLSNDTYYVP